MKTLIHTMMTLMLGLAWAGGAQAILLSDLLAGGSITARDKVFDQWRLIRQDYSDPALTVDPGNIDVSALVDGGLDPGPGLRFTAMNDVLTVTGDGIFAFIDYMFGFRVTSLGPAIKDNSLEITNALRTTSGDNGVFIQELVGTNPANVENPSLVDLGIKGVEFSWLDPALGGPGSVANPSDSAIFLPKSEIFVSKNILVWASGIDETASLLSFDQRFSQVPEIDAAAGTSAATLLGIALALAGERRRNPRRAVGWAEFTKPINRERYASLLLEVPIIFAYRHRPSRP